MNHLIQQGKILYWGTSEWSAAEIMEAFMVAEKYRLIGPTMEQPQYNLFERTKLEKDYLTIFEDVGLGTTIWSPLASGLLTGKYNDGIPKGSRLDDKQMEWLKNNILNDNKIERVRNLQKVADELGTSLATLSIAWTISNPDVTTAILGATRKEQLEENLKALEVYPKLTPDVKDRIDEIMGTKPVPPML
jgi:aryl-alcohol dehydrogenase-like predicted oxidoreductase